MRVTLFNLVEPVVPLFRMFVRLLVEMSASHVDIIFSELEYRPGRFRLEDAVPLAHGVKYAGGSPLASRPGLRRLEVTLRYLAGVCRAVLSAPPKTINVVLSQPPGLQTLVVLLCRFRDQRTILHVMDLYPDVVVASGRLPETSILTKAWGWVSKWTLQNADSVVVIGVCMRERLLELGVSADRVHVVRNWAHGVGQAPQPAVDAARNDLFEVDEPFVVGYSGNIGVAHDLTPMLEAAEELAGREPLIRFLIRGDGKRRREVETAVDERGLENVTMTGFVPESELGVALSVPDVHVVSLRDEFTGLVVPSKAYGALAAGRPVIFIGSPKSDVARDLVEFGAGFIASNGLEVVDAIEQLRDVKTWEGYSRRASQLAEVRSERAAKSSYRKILKGVEVDA